MILTTFAVINYEGYPRRTPFRGVYHKTVTITNMTSDWIRPPADNDIETIATGISLDFASNQAKIEYTLVPILYDSLTNTSNFYTWNLGLVSSSTNDTYEGAAFAFRIVALTNVVTAYFVFKVVKK